MTTAPSKANPAAVWTLAGAALLALVSIGSDLLRLFQNAVWSYFGEHPLLSLYWVIKVLGTLALAAGALLLALKGNKKLAVLGVVAYAVLDLIRFGVGYVHISGQPDITPSEAWGFLLTWFTPENGFEWLHYVAMFVSSAGAVVAAVTSSNPKVAGAQAAARVAAPVGFDPQTGRPIVGYDVNTGAPIYQEQ